ncbi:MAG TPA: hypothetical protein VFO23_07210 [Steroidobacteraceae bacterium]|nr:hypothetical protein [Steroidobacteraceae bacterium]
MRIATLVALAALDACGGSGGGATSDTPLNSTSPPAAPAGYARFVYPTSGQLGVDGSQKFQWSAVEGASYQLQVGTAVGGNDVFDSGVIATTSVAVPHLPASGTVYARVRVIPQGWGTALQPGTFPRGTYVTFSMDANVSGAAFTFPTAGGSADADEPISWQPDPLAQSYRLTVADGASGAMLSDSGPIGSAQRVVAGLPPGATVVATLATSYLQGIVHTRTVTFTVGNPVTTGSGMLTAARNLTTAVREMADGDNQPYDGTLLAAAAAAENDAAADCVAFSNTLLTELADANIPLQYRARGMCFNSPDCHELIEVLDPASQRWITLDPTFGLYALNSSGQPATVEEISAAVRASAFSTVGFTYLTPNGDGYVRGYYVDYPLLFLNVYQAGSTSAYEQAQVPLEPYFDLMGATVNGAVSGFFALECAAGASSATATWDGTSQTYPCHNGFTEIFYGISVSLGQGNSSAVSIGAPHRFVF